MSVADIPIESPAIKRFLDKYEFIHYKGKHYKTSIPKEIPNLSLGEDLTTLIFKFYRIEDLNDTRTITRNYESGPEDLTYTITVRKKDIMNMLVDSHGDEIIADMLEHKFRAEGIQSLKELMEDPAWRAIYA